MKILIVTQYFWPENFRINDLAAGLVERGHEVTVFTGVPNYPQGSFFPGYGLFKNARQEYNGTRVIRVPLLPRGKGGRLSLVLNYLSFAAIAAISAPFFCRGTFDLIFVFQTSPVTVGIPAIVLKKIKRIPIVFWVQDLWPESLSATGAIKSQFILNRVRALVRFIYRFCDKILVQSRSFAPLIENQGVDSNRILYFPNSAEKIYRPVALPDQSEDLAVFPTGFRVVFAGNIGAAQDFATVLSAARKLRNYPDIHWIILGDGRMRSWVETQVIQGGLTDTVHLLGRYPLAAMPYYFSQADVMLVTLKRDPIFAITIPSKIQSYMACGRPIVAALDGEAQRVVLEAGAGLVSPAEDADALAESIVTMYGLSKEQREEMGKRGIRYYESHFARDVLIDRLEGWMQELSSTTST